MRGTSVPFGPDLLHGRVRLRGGIGAAEDDETPARHSGSQGRRNSPQRTQRTQRKQNTENRE